MENNPANPLQTSTPHARSTDTLLCSAAPERTANAQRSGAAQRASSEAAGNLPSQTQAWAAGSPRTAAPGQQQPASGAFLPFKTQILCAGGSPDCWRPTEVMVRSGGGAAARPGPARRHGPGSLPALLERSCRPSSPSQGLRTASSPLPAFEHSTSPPI